MSMFGSVTAKCIWERIEQEIKNASQQNRTNDYLLGLHKALEIAKEYDE